MSGLDFLFWCMGLSFIIFSIGLVIWLADEGPEKLIDKWRQK